MAVAMRWLVVGSVFIVAGCGHHHAVQEPAGDPPPPEHWETVTDQRFVFPDRCATGPFEITLPERRDEWGRRFVVQFYGTRDRGLAIDDRIDAGRTQWGVGFTIVPEGDHSRCRVADHDTPVAAAPGHHGGHDSKHDKPAPPPVRATIADADAGGATLPQLVIYHGELTGTATQVGAVAWMPRGNPYYYADEYWTAHDEGESGLAGFRYRFWFGRPSDVDGVVVRILDQRLVPEHPGAAYAAEFSRRVTEARAKLAAYQPKARAEAAKVAEDCAKQETALCKAMQRKSSRLPPPPRAEVRPPAPSANVDWAPGYWSWSDDDDDFLWVAGTFVLRPPPVVATAPPPSPAPAPPPTAVASTPPAAPPSAVEAAPAAAPEPARPVAAQVTAAPPPRVDPIPPPPLVVGVMWVAGHWELVGTAWIWRAGQWVVPPQSGSRYRAPVVRTRGAVRVYVPGGWIRVR